MRKHVWIACIFFFTATNVRAQKYALIDETFATPVQYVNTIDPQIASQKLFPVEQKYLLQFLKALEEIHKDLKNGKRLESAREFHFGCTRIKGIVAALERETRFNYVITSDCDQVHTTFQLCDVKFKNATNAFIVSTWIKYIRSNLRHR